MTKSADAFRTISEVAEWLGTPAHVLRFWESKFTQVKPVKRAGGRRYYRPQDMRLLWGIKKLLHDDGMTIKGVQKIMREHGVKHVAALSDAISLEVEDDAADMLIDVPVAEPLDTVVPFAKPDADGADPTGKTAPTRNTAKHRMVVSDVSTETASSAPVAPDSDASEPRTAPPALAPTAPISATPPIRDAHTPSAASETSAGALSLVARIRKVTPDQARKIAPLVAQLRTRSG